MTGKLVAIYRCSQCPHGGLRFEEEVFCNRYHKKAPKSGIPSWCRLRPAPRERRRKVPVEMIKVNV